MFTFEKGDYKFVFEYDTMEEFHEGVRLAQETYEKLRENINSDTIAKNLALMNEIRSASFMGQQVPVNDIRSMSGEEYQRGITFEDLEIRFIASKQKKREKKRYERKEKKSKTIWTNTETKVRTSVRINQNPYAKKVKKKISLNVNIDTIKYFKELAGKMGLPHQTLINSFLTDCAQRHIESEFKWTSQVCTNWFLV